MRLEKVNVFGITDRRVAFLREWSLMAFCIGTVWQPVVHNVRRKEHMGRRKKIK